MKLTKKQLIIVISAAVLLVAAIVLAVVLILRGTDKEREIFYYEDFGYVIKDDGRLEIVSYSGSDTDVIVPTAIDSRSVTSIGDGAFLGNKMKTLKLGTFVTSIGDSAFHSCTSLETIIWNTVLREIDDYAFYMCVSLKSAELPASVSSIGKAAFAECSSIESLFVPPAVTSLSDYVFFNCAGITSFDCASLMMSRRMVRKAIFMGLDTSATYSTASAVTYSCVLPGKP